MIRVYQERAPHEPPGGISLISMRRPGGRMRAAIHPDNAVSLGGLSPDVKGDQLHGVGIAVFPDPEISNRAHLIRRDIAVALVVFQRQAGWVVGERPQASRLVDGESGIVAN